ncbi:MerC family mercury resistance protein [Spiribacter halobius]|uniref:Methyltransferase type 11 n=1 Tax=Sediminicurvatus halobius TaxID=2182432 RepID=A0A2U2N4D1_9GAMM|nr:MerC family mercury resistance protein [Spiribacter halobius]PWG63952.1 methyltransferase type 11 [Spiribacter halobius]UEX76367.1 methyltransferase domain-containing protein [Spiribacter halobius]
MVAILGYSREQILHAVQGMYTLVARQPGAGFHFPTGADAAATLGYPRAELDAVPEALLERFAGVGYALDGDAVHAGDVVLDVGAGAGIDTVLAARRAGPHGYAIALDLTPAMTRLLGTTLREHGLTNVGVVQGSAERIPLRDSCIDSITSNGALNLVPDKRRAIAELFRVLRPGGRLQMADVVIDRPVTVDCDSDPRLWVECVVGATVEENLIELFRETGFEDIRINRRLDYFAHSPSAQTREIAASFGAHTVELAMRRAERQPPLRRRLLHRYNPVRLGVHLWRHGWLGLLALALALVSCYGTLALASVLPVVGFAFAPPPGAWSASILAFSGIALGAVALGHRRHARRWPFALAMAGAAILVYTLLFRYHPLVELAGFALLGCAVFSDRRLRRRREARILGLNPGR